MSRKRHVMLPRKKMQVTGYDYPMTKAGSTANVDVLYATSLGINPGAILAGQVLKRVEADFQLVQSWFGAVKIPRVTCLIAPLSAGNDGSGGAYHWGCSGTDLYCDADFLDDGSTTLALFVAELSEVFQAAQGGLWDCSASNGEALSRLHAEQAHPGVLDGYSTAAAWLDSPDRPDWISQSEPTDQDATSTGCGVLFLTWFLSRGFSVAQITQAAASTLAGTYTALGLPFLAVGVYNSFQAVCQMKWPLGAPSGVVVDNPWGAAPLPPTIPVPPPAPPAPAPAGTVIQLAPGVYTITVKGA